MCLSSVSRCCRVVIRHCHFVRRARARRSEGGLEAFFFFNGVLRFFGFGADRLLFFLHRGATFDFLDF